jgi:hypothetical protein
VGKGAGQMNVFFDLGFKSWGIDRVISALNANLPNNIVRVLDPAQADLVILHVWGRHDHVSNYAKELIKQGKKYAVIQYVLQSSRNPDPMDWMPLWSNAKVVWSYYDLSNIPSFKLENFYHAPLASNPDVFYRVDNAEKKYLAGTDGNNFRAECIGETHLTTWNLKKNAVHIGQPFDANPIVTYLSNITDDELRDVHNQCEYFVSLRRKDGFELPAIQSMLCGVRPIVFDTPNYRQWFDGLAIFIPEVGVKETAYNLGRVMAQPPKPMLASEIDEVKRRFDWSVIIGGFWERCNE